MTSDVSAPEKKRRARDRAYDEVYDRLLEAEIEAAKEDAYVAMCDVTGILDLYIATAGELGHSVAHERAMDAAGPSARLAADLIGEYNLALQHV